MHLDGVLRRQRRAARRRSRAAPQPPWVSTGSECTAMSGDAAQRRVALFRAAEIERAADAQAPHDGDVVIGEMAEMVGAEDLPPAHDAAVACGIAAEIAEIAGAGEVEMAGREI